MNHRRRSLRGSLLTPILVATAACGTVPLDSGVSTLVDVRLDPELLALSPRGVSSRVDAPEPERFEQPAFYFESARQPLFSLRADQDPQDPVRELAADLEVGDGYGMATGILVDGFGLGLLYLTSDRAFEAGEEEARFHAAFIEARVCGEQNLGFALGTLSLGLGVGAGGVGFADLFSDSIGTALEARLMMGVELGSLSLELGGGRFTWDVPGEPLGDGTYLAAGLTLRL